MRMPIHNTDPDVIKESTFNYLDVRYQRNNFQRSTGRSYQRIKEPRIQITIFDPDPGSASMILDTVIGSRVRFSFCSSVGTDIMQVHR
jgi:hypothetical protein